MALIKCPECNSEVSDRAEKCIKCGFPLAKYVPSVKCPECGGESPGGAVACGKCGFPLRAERAPLNQERVVAAGVAPKEEALDPLEAAANFTLWQGFGNGWKNFAKFDGRARRKEFWGWVLFRGIFSVGLITIFAFGGADAVSIISRVITVATFIPNLAVSVRRVHDTGHGGAWVVVGELIFLLVGLLTPVYGFMNILTIGWIAAGIYGVVLFFFAIDDGRPGENRFGPDPKGLVLDLDMDDEL